MGNLARITYMRSLDLAGRVLGGQALWGKPLQQRAESQWHPVFKHCSSQGTWTGWKRGFYRKGGVTITHRSFSGSFFPSAPVLSHLGLLRKWQRRAVSCHCRLVFMWSFMWFWLGMVKLQHTSMCLAERQIKGILQSKLTLFIWMGAGRNRDARGRLFTWVLC